MMQEKLNEWTGRVWQVLSTLPGKPEAVAELRRRWQNVNQAEELRVVIFGAYDAGKSTLLKRLLVESGTPVPEWLTISGRRETFDVREVRSDGFLFIDTPGIGSGNSEHDKLSLEAMKLADAYLWVLPPQLVTTGKDLFFEVLKGSYFSDRLPASAVASSTLAAVARMDEAGIDPADNLAGFRDLTQRKIGELESMLSLGGVDATLRAVFCVIADPYQMVGNTSEPDRGSFEVGREWDGIDLLVGAIRDLCADQAEMRAMAGARFVAVVSRETLHELREMEGELDLAAQESVNEIDRYRLFEQRLKSLRGQAEAELRKGIEGQLLSASRMGSDSIAESARQLETALSQVVDDWYESCFSDYRRLVSELEVEIQERTTSPSTAGFRRLADEAEASESGSKRPSIDPTKAAKRILGVGPSIRKAFTAYAASELGMSLKTAAERLEKIESSGETVEGFLKAQGRNTAFRSTSHAEKASRMVKWGRVLEAIGPLVEQLAGALSEAVEEISSAKRAQERANRRLELREKLRHEASKLESEAAARFDATCDGLRSWLGERISAFEEAQSGIDARVRALRGSAEDLAEVLGTFPVQNETNGQGERRGS